MRKKGLLITLLIVLISLMPMAGQAQDDVSVSVMANWGGVEQVGFEAVLAAFTEATGIATEYIGDRNAEVTVQAMIAAGNPPDIQSMPRPGVVAEFARDGVLQALTSGDDPIIPLETLQANYAQGIIDQGMVDGEIYGILHAPNSKSTVWYRTDTFADLDLEAPATWDEFLELVDILGEEGIAPLSMGGLDGWTLTDLFENIYVRVAGPEDYIKLFVTHEIEWTDDSVVEAMGHFADLISPTDEKLLGGAEGALATDFIGGMDQMLRGESGLYYEGGFMGNFGEQNFPDMSCGEDFSFFLFPPISEEIGAPVVGGGGLWIVYNDRPEVRELIRYLQSPEALTVWASQPEGARLPASHQVPEDAVGGACNKLEAAQIANADGFVFDGSDLAPGAVGGDAMFTGLQNFVANPDDIAGVLEFIEGVADTAYDM